MGKRLLAFALASAMVFSMVACGTSGGTAASSTGTAASTAAVSTASTNAVSAATSTATSTSTSIASSAAASTAVSGKGTHIYVLTAAENHGWVGSVATFAKEKVEEINAAGNYTSEVITSDGAADQIQKIEDVLSKGEKNIAFVIQPMDDTVQSAIQEVVDAGIPYCAFDRIIESLAPTAVSNVKGDNAGIGYAAGAYFVSLGLKPGDSVYVYEGDTTSVTTLRDQGFQDYLTGKAEYDGKKIDDANKWTDDQLSSIKYSGAMNWSRSDTKTSFESLMGDANNAGIKWFYAQDDDLALGILEALNGGGIDENTKAKFLANKPVITGCGGNDEYYAVLRGETYKDLAAQCGGLMSATYSPSMIQTTIQDMVDYLDGKQVSQDHVIKSEIVTSENVANFEGFK